jgi:two-component system sensor histidine kinase AlgZ
MAQNASTIANHKLNGAIAAPAPLVSGKKLSARWRANLLIIMAGTVTGMQIDFLIKGFPDWRVLPNHFVHALTYSTVIGLMLIYLLTWCGGYIARRRFPLNWALLFLVILIPALAGTYFCEWLLVTLGQHPPGQCAVSLAHSLQVTLLLSLIFGVSLYLYDNLRGELEATTLQLRNKQLEEERARKLAIAAQLSSLESRVRPHFLFNTLNSIAALVRENPEHAERMVGQLSALLRFSLAAHRHPTTLLRDEIRLVNDYLEIEQARFNGRLRFTVDVPAELSAVEVPPFALQTLVENSVKYAVAPRRTGGEIHVRARAESDNVKLEVRDDGPGFSAEAITSGHGLDTLQSRLAALFADKGLLDIQTGAQGTAVTVTLPRERTSGAMLE